MSQMGLRTPMAMIGSPEKSMMTVETYIEYLKKLDGIAELRSHSGQFLGRLESKPYSFYSIINVQGFYGSSSSSTSIRNSSSQYGGFKGIYSPFNPNCSNPPFIACSGQPLMLVTRNPQILTFGLNSITPDFLLAVYEILGRSKPHEVSMKLLALKRTRATAIDVRHTIVIPSQVREESLMLSR
ncbi:hypothetical protein [Allocoleopsis sp.]|uniref:hypothetical protein n=1 Tax=Allocoleopsis sp. TaxID=3088169 RepID=UPI002FD11CE7